MLDHDTGVLAATTAFGKTVLAAWLIAKRGVSTLVLVHRQQLMEQWVDRLCAFLGVSTKDIGRLGGGRKKLNGKLDIAIIQSLVRKGEVDDRIEGYGHLIVDECHHLAAHSFEMVARRSKAKFIMGLSATVARKDGHHPIITMQCGPIRFRANARDQAKQRPFIHQVFVRPTGFRMSEVLALEARIPFHKLYGELLTDPARNRMICEDVLSAVAEGRTPLLLTERTEHLDYFVSELSSKVAHVVTLKGGMGKNELKASLARLLEIPANEGRVIIATGGFIGEGFDDSRLDTLFLGLPISWRGTIAQYAGRLHRLHDGKTEVRVYDYADLNVAVLSRMFDRRCKGYEAVGYRILLPASAVPGWPPEVPLPIDPEWNKNFASSVRRLIRDGVDQNLANLFVFAARKPSPGSEGIDRARSASEAFLYRRLETLPQTANRFKLNQKVPIPFDGWSEMEVDLLNSQLKLVIELDGEQHLGDADAYRRDRRKDSLLQQHGYFVHRFLVADLGKRLDHILDSILSTLVHLENQQTGFSKPKRE